MADSQRRLILANGEQYIDSVEKKFQSRATEPPRSYGEARDLVKKEIQSSIQSFGTLPDSMKLPEEAVFCLRLHPDATAKTYSPESIFNDIPDLRNVGSRMYRTPVGKVAETERVTKQREKKIDELEGRLVFVQSSLEGFDRFLKRLDTPASKLTKKFQHEIQRVERFDMLRTAEQIVGFSEDWKEGRAELVLHPSHVSNERQREYLFELFESVGIDSSKAKIRAYAGGPTFVSCRLSKKSLQALAGANPLRAVHPLRFGAVTDLRSAQTADSPKPAASTTRSTIKIGMFDGGVDATVPLLRGHVEEDLSLAIKTPPNAICVAHGTAVAGALLHGELNRFTSKDRLAAPPVSVVSIRALPTSDPADVDMFESIDVVERTVPARKDIRVYNLSFGPRGPIQDDPVSRFTYVLDSLAHVHKVGFFVAVGNDGEHDGLNRIQAPSDLVHGIGVGAYTMDGNDIVRASYSCIGPGRECGKVKPDISAFGGCPNHPIHLVSTDSGKKLLSWGTSFASPLAARIGAQASEGFDRSSTLLARALMIHTAAHPNKTPDHHLGHGSIPVDYDDMLLCSDKSVTVVFIGDILPTRIVKLPIPWPRDGILSGKVQVTWTVAGLPPIDPNHPGDYTSCCLEETLYPHSERYSFASDDKKAKKTKTLHLTNDAAEIKQLLTKKWKQAAFPISESGNKYKDESMLRALDCKWEPVVRRSVSKLAKNFVDPFMTIHAIGRNGAKERFDYAVVVTVDAPEFDGDLYAAIRSQFPALVPIRIRTEAEIRIKVE